MKGVNRNILVVFPSKKMVDWINYIFPDNPMSHESLLGNDGADTFLVPNFDSIKETEEWLKENFILILERQLEGWCTDPELWPKPLNWKLFVSFLDYKLHTIVRDLANEPLSSRELGY